VNAKLTFEGNKSEAYSFTEVRPANTGGNSKAINSLNKKYYTE
jgi:hypothetical protein